MDKRKMKKLLILNLPYFLVGLFATNLGEAWRLAEGADSSAKILSFFHALPIALNNPFPSFHPLDLLIGILCGAGLRLAVYLKGKNAKKYRHNVEYGSARWGTAKDIEPFIAPKFEDNVILTKTERLMMSNRPKNPANARNKNVLIIGGSGSGKTRFWLKPNLLQMHSSYVVTDPKGSIVIECGNALLKHGYTIKIFNTINFQKSMHYNPFAYIHSEKDILKLVTTLIANTKGDGKAGDEFWTKAETLLYCALIGYIHYEAPVEEQNFSTLIEFLNAMEVREDDEEFQNPVDLMFEALEKKKPNHFAVRQYKKYKLAAGKTAKSILISCGARLAPFDIQEVRDVTAYDELQLDTLGDKKTALFAQSIAKVLGAAKREDGYLEGNGYVVSWCVGHLVELAQPEVYDAKYSKWAYADLPIFPMDWQYEVSAGTKKQFGILKKLMAREDVASLVCATDAGREGELIFRLVYHKAGCRKPFERLWISSMEDVAIKEGFENLRSGTEYDALYEAALCRERADWIVGINATRLFSTLYGQTLNVGRVMTPTLAMAVMREAAISAFKPELFYTVQIGLDGFTAASERFKTKAAAEAVKQSCSVAIVQKAECKEKTEKPPALYDLTSLQREANRVLGYTAQQTLDYTQNLYEKKLVTYPRTDSRFLTEDMAHSLTDLVKLAFHTFPVR